MKKPRRRPWRRGLKWAGAVVALAIAVAWIASVWWTLCVYAGPFASGGEWRLIFARSNLVLDRDLVTGPPWKGDTVRTICIPNQYVEKNFLGHGLPTFDNGTTIYSSTRKQVWALTVPFWIPFAAIAIPTLWLWRPARRFKNGCPTCGYSREGLAAGAVCPECGEGAPRA